MKREAVKKWLWEHMHESIADTIEALNVKLTGALQILWNLWGTT